jgi:hypothetical protein
MRAVSAGEDATIAEAIHYVGSLRGSGGASGAIEDEVYAEEESCAANVADDSMLGLQGFQAGDEIVSYVVCVFLEMLGFEDV